MTRNPTDRTLLVTHKNCLDGTGCAAVFVWAGGRRENIIFKPPHACDLSPDEVSGFDEVWFADLCPKNLDDPTCGLLFHVFDHHKSNMERAGSCKNCTFSMEHSGTSLLARETDVFSKCRGGYHSTDEGRWISDYERIVRALEAYDLGRFDYREGQYMADLAATLTQEQMLDMFIERGENASSVLNDPLNKARVEAAQNARTLYAQKAAKDALYLDWRPPGEIYGPVRTGVSLSPEQWKNAVAQEILREADLAIIVDTTSWSVSFRSNRLDVSQMAQEYGGGGHKAASGFKINPHDALRLIIEEIFG